MRIGINTSGAVKALVNLCQAYQLTPTIEGELSISLNNKMQIKYFIEKLCKFNFVKILDEAPEFYEETLNPYEEGNKCTMM